MKSHRSSPVPAALIMVAILMLIAIVAWLAPYGAYEARHRWFFHQIRQNPTCVFDWDCFSTTTCLPAKGVRCVWPDGEYEGFCVCARHGMRPENVSTGCPISP
jgi:hypothetical protein